VPEVEAVSTAGHSTAGIAGGATGSLPP
jgi:hypothetical protein